MWLKEVAKVCVEEEREKRRELVLSGKTVEANVKQFGLDPAVFELVNLNFLEISDAGLESLPELVGQLTHLTNLVLKGNAIAHLPVSLGRLEKLKLLDVSKNRLTSLPDMSSLQQLATLNISLNKFVQFPDVGIEKCTKLATIDLSVNDLTDISTLENATLELLAELNLNRNEVNQLSGCIKQNWPCMKKLDLSDNKLKSVPVELGDFTKLKELNLANNPLLDNRLKKMAAQKSTKSVLEYIRQHGDKGGSGETGKAGNKKGKKGQKASAEEKNETAAAAAESAANVEQLCDNLCVMNFCDVNPEVYTHPPVKDVRPYIVICIVRNLNLTGENLRKFLQLQTKIHKGVCANRTLGTVATHDLAAVKGPLKYTALHPEAFSVEPLMGGKPVKASKLVSRLKAEAEALRKEKKRSQVSGVHQYLPMVEKHPVYPCLMDTDERVISFPPVTNSGITRISEETKSILVEVTSSTKLADAKLIADTLLREMLECGLGDVDSTHQLNDCLPNNDEPSVQSSFKTLRVEQGRVLDEGGSLKVTYPSRTDLVYEKAHFSVVRA